MELLEIAARIERISEQYAEIHGIDRSAEWALLKLVEEVGELAQAHLTSTGQSKDRGLTQDEQRRAVTQEIGDVIGMILVFARQVGVDPEVAVAEKWFAYER